MAIKDIGFVILTWNSEKYIGRCLNSMMDFSIYETVIQIVDNGSGDLTCETVRRYMEEYPGQDIRLVCLPSNEGTTVSRNIGIRAIEHECRYICILDSDAMVTEQAMSILIRELESNSKNGIVGPLMRDEMGNLQNTARNIPTLQEKLLKVMPIKRLQEKGELLEGSVDIGGGSQPAGYLLSACWLMRNGLFRTIGYMDEKIFYAPEDVEFCIRTWKAGYRIVYCPEAQILHSWQRISREQLLSKHNFEHVKGLFYLYKKYGFLLRNQQFKEDIK